MTAGARAVRPGLYSRRMLTMFAAGAHEAFMASGGRPLRPRLARSLALAELRPGLRVVDVGSGRGEAALHCVRRGCDVLAVDYAPGATALTRETLALAKGAGGGRGRVVAAAAGGLPVADGTADRVLMLDVLEHLTPREAGVAMAEIRRILAPGGRVVLHTLPNRWALATVYPAARMAGIGLPRRPRSAYETRVHVNEQSPHSLYAVLGEAGFERRVWVEEWTTRYAARGAGRTYPDALRRQGYRALRPPWIRWLAGVAMRTPARWLAGNDLFALAWRPGDSAPCRRGRFRPVGSAAGVSKC